MPNIPLYSLNGGEVGKEALARLDLERLQFCGSIYSNVVPRVVGAMSIRPGLEHIAYADFDQVFPIEYSYSGDANIVPFLSENELRVFVNSALVSRASVSTAITNSSLTFSGPTLSGWSVGGRVESVSGYCGLVGTTQASASISQTISVSGGEVNTEHAIRLKVIRGPVSMKVGTTSGGFEILEQVNLNDGEHSIAFTPGTTLISVTITNDNARPALLESCAIEGAGVMVLPAPWGNSDLSENIIRYTQHKDVVYVASGAYQQRMIIRRGDTSWSIQRYKVDDGYFRVSDGKISLQPSSLVDNGTVTLTSSRPYFDSRMVGRLFRIYQSGQRVEEQFSSAPAEGDYIRISGVETERSFDYTVGGTWTGTVLLQISIDDGDGSPSSWTTIKTITANESATYTDEDDNVIKYVRFAVEAAALTSGTIETILNYESGTQQGVARMTGYQSSTVANIEILSRFYSTDASFEWDYSTWSDYDGWPAAVEKFGGRLYWFMTDICYGSVPDIYDSYSDEVEGASAPISRSVGVSTSRGVLAAIGLQRLIAVTDSSEISIKSSSYDDPLTETAWFPTDISNVGSRNLRLVKVDKDGIVVQASGTSAYRITYDGSVSDYNSFDLMEMHDDVCDGSPIVDLFVQRKPDPVVWFVLANGEARCVTYRPDQNVIGWWRFVTDGLIKRGCASRGTGQDNVFLFVERAGTLRFEKLAALTDCAGGSKNCLADAFSHFTASSQTTFSVPHLNGLDVTVWVNGAAVHDQDNLYTVSGSQVVLASPVTGDVVIGLPYTARWQSVKLAYAAKNGTALFQYKKVSSLGLYLINTILDGLRVGKDFSTLRKLAIKKRGRPIADGELQDEFDVDMQSVSSDWDTDCRICIEHKSPYPLTVSAMAMDIKTNG